MKSLAAAFVLALTATTVGAGLVHAEPTAADAATARSLFDEARKLMKQGKYGEACPKLEEGVRLNPGIGMRFNLASCYEHLGKTASAWNLYLDVAAAAKLAKQPEREKEARKAAGKLESKLSKLTIDIPAADRVAGLEIKRDGTLLGDGALGTATAVDPGPHTIEATAPDHEPWTTTVEIKPEKDLQTVAIPRLKKIEKPKPPPPPPPPPPPGLGPTKTTALIVGGVGVVGLGLGAFFGARALSLKSDSDTHCDGNTCDPQGFELRTDARAWGNASTVAIVVGSAAVAGAAVLWFTAGSPEKPKDKASIQPWVGQGSGGINVWGAF